MEKLPYHQQMKELPPLLIGILINQDKNNGPKNKMRNWAYFSLPT